MKLTKKLFEKKVKFTVAEDKTYQYIYNFCHLDKINSYIEENATGDVIEDCIIESFLCEKYSTFFKVYYVFFGIFLSKNINYKDCTVVEN